MHSEGLAPWRFPAPLMREHSRCSAFACEVTRSCYSCRVFVIREVTPGKQAKASVCGGVPLSGASVGPLSSSSHPLQIPRCARRLFSFRAKCPYPGLTPQRYLRGLEGRCGHLTALCPGSFSFFSPRSSAAEPVVYSPERALESIKGAV